MSRLGWIPALAEKIDPEWVAKIILLVGIWLWGPLFGNLEMQMNVNLFFLIFVSFSVIFSNKFYDDFVEPFLSDLTPS